MTPDEIDIAIAESLGWLDVRLCRIFGAPGLVLRGNVPFNNNGVIVYTREDVPRYAYSLDACVIFEATLTDEEYSKYALWLGPLTSERQRLYISASPIKRCEAYLRLKGLWRD